MSSTSPSRLAKINVPRMILWLASLVVVVGGYFLMTISNSHEAAVYSSGTADYPKLFAAQSGSTIGGLLIAVGALGALLALASMAVTWRPAATRVVPASESSVLDADAADDFGDEEPSDAPAPSGVTREPTSAAPVVR